MRAWRSTAVAAAAAVAIGGVVLFSDAEPAQDVRLLSGAAWLASSNVGQVTLLDGATAEVSAQLQVSSAGNLLEVVQQGSTAYVVDQSTGTMRRVDGAHFTMTDPQTPIADASAELTAIPATSAVYAFDARRGILADTDPKTLERRGDMMSVANRLTNGTATVDNSGVFWAVDNSNGQLTRVENGKRSFRTVTSAGENVLTIANNHPVLVNKTNRQAVAIDQVTGTPSDPLPLDLRADDTIQVSGSAHSERVYVVLKRGVLTVCDLGTGSCDKTIPLTSGNDFGAAVETNDRLFLPNYTTGEVWIIDLAKSTIIGKPSVLPNTGKFQLLTRDGVVFYNDTNSYKAGVIQLDGKVKETKKYDPDAPHSGLTVPVANNPVPPQAGQPPVPVGNNPNNPQNPTNPQNPQGPNNPANPPNPTNPQPPNGNPNNPNNPTNPNSPNSPNDSADTSELQVTMSSVQPTSGNVVTMEVANPSGSKVVGASWDFGDGSPKGTKPTTEHTWTTSQESTTFWIRVDATLENGKTKQKFFSIVVSKEKTYPLTVNVSGSGTVSDSQAGINCAGMGCTVHLKANQAVTLTAKATGTGQLGTWSGCTSQPAPDKCSFTMGKEAKTVGHTFKAAPQKVTFKATPPANGKIQLKGVGHNHTCPGDCEMTVDVGAKQMTAESDDVGDYSWESWGGVCQGQKSSICELPTNTAGTYNVTAKYTDKKVTLTVVCESVGAGEGAISSGSGRCETGGGKQFTIRGLPNDLVTLKATPTPTPDLPKTYWNFLEGWSGGGCPSNVVSYQPTSCTVKLPKTNLTVTGTFRKPHKPLN